MSRPTVTRAELVVSVTQDAYVININWAWNEAADLWEAHVSNNASWLHARRAPGFDEKSRQNILYWMGAFIEGTATQKDVEAAIVATSSIGMQHDKARREAQIKTAATAAAILKAAEDQAVLDRKRNAEALAARQAGVRAGRIG
jgi:hypothetical protein